MLSEKLRRLGDELSRRQVGEWYREALDGSGLDLPGDRGSRVHAFHQFVVRVPRDEVRQRLMDEGIGTLTRYPTPVHPQPRARGLCEVPERPLRAEGWAGVLISLPLFATLTRDEVGRVGSALRAAMGR